MAPKTDFINGNNGMLTMPYMADSYSTGTDWNYSSAQVPQLQTPTVQSVFNQGGAIRTGQDPYNTRNVTNYGDVDPYSLGGDYDTRTFNTGSVGGEAQSSFTPYADNSGMFGTQPYNEQMANYAGVPIDQLPASGTTAYTDMQKGMDAQNKYMNSQGVDYMGWAGAGADVLGGISQIGSYFNNRDLAKAQIKGINANIDNLKFAQNQRKDFTSGTKSAFA